MEDDVIEAIFENLGAKPALHASLEHVLQHD
jgi:hypothetical protein